MLVTSNAGINNLDEMKFDKIIENWPEVGSQKTEEKSSVYISKLRSSVFGLRSKEKKFTEKVAAIELQDFNH